jgi:hypothetical protein
VHSVGYFYYRISKVQLFLRAGYKRQRESINREKLIVSKAVGMEGSPIHRTTVCRDGNIYV